MAKVGPCMACLVLKIAGLLASRRVVYGCGYNHAKSGNRRRGHMFGYALCVWHRCRHPNEGKSLARTRAISGPSLMDGSRVFRET